MKKLTSVCLIGIALLVNSCSHKCCTPPNNGIYLYAQKNNTAWSASPTTFKNLDTTVIAVNMNEEHLLIKIKFSGVGQYTLTGNQINYYNTVGQDAKVSNYIAGNSATSVLNIMDYRQDTNYIDGTLSLNLTKTYGNPDASFVKTISFLNGAFQVQLPAK